MRVAWIAIVVAFLGWPASAGVQANGSYTHTPSSTTAWVDFCVGAGYFEATCDAELQTAGACSDLDQPLPTQTCSAANVTAGRCRAALQGQVIPELQACGAYADLTIRRWGRDTRDRGKQILHRRAQSAPPSTGEAF